ncbi:PucR family transcriptional regulator [Desulfitobacterium sp. Sab5]|uniref:PucR family transcriptional regulator n=1 Tax=Desulfitobacterium nosdiversum TaxID=3375356 RepID=UPI003CF67222
MEKYLPYAITLNRFLESQHLSPADDMTISLLKGMGQWSIRTLDLNSDQVITLPLLGRDFSLKYEEDSSISITFSDVEARPLRFIQSTKIPLNEFGEKAISWIEREQGKILSVVEKYTQELAEQLANGKGFTVLQDLRAILGFDLFIINNQLEILEWAGGRQLPLEALAFISPKRTMQGLFLRDRVFFQGEWVDPQDVPLTWYPLHGQPGILGYLGLAASKESLGSIEQLFLHKAATLFLLELTKTYHIQENERHYHRDFLFDLLYNNFDSLEVIISRGKLWGWDFSKPHLVLVGEIPGFDPDSPQQEIFNDILTDMMAVLRNQWPKSICLERNNQVVILFQLPDFIPSTLWVEQAKTLLQPVLRLNEEYPRDQQLLFGLGNLYPTARYIHRSFQEARSALELGQLFNLENRIIAFQDLGVMRLLYKLDRQELEDYRNEILGPMLKFDKENNLALEETLLAYFTSSTDINAAGDKLFLHPNTLRYRLKKAAEILGRDLTVLENQVNLFIALKIGKLKSLWPE